MFNIKTNYRIIKGAIFHNTPFYVQFYISKNCFLKCRMCNIVQENACLSMVNLEQIEKIAANLNKIGAAVVLLTGGEPFLRNDIVDIVRIFRKYGLTPRLQTAGLIQKFDNMLECCKLGAKDINVSLDTLDEELGDFINGVKGSWRQSIKTIGKITRDFPDHDTVCALGCVLSPHNVDRIEEVLEFADRIGWSLSLVPVHINREEEGYHFRGFRKEFLFDEEGMKKVEVLIERLHKKKKDGANLFDSRKYLDSIVDFVKTNHPTWRKKGQCDSPHIYFAIRPDGSFAPCCDQDIDEKIYVYDDNFPSIYKSREFRKSVYDITKKCPGCNFGSYPEMTLLSRDFPTFLERCKLELRGSKHKMKPYTDEELFDIIEKIKLKRQE